MANVKNLRTGFTGELDDASGLASKARQAATYVKDEASAVARTAQDHPSATSTALLVFGISAFVAGYLMGSTSNPPQRGRYW
ncbi:hypothetical protein [Pararhizobium gei]|uniref:hypothetical protein n=1 Tax=Pararhizobium gei TaxID=1395951 RepID=UPI0023DBA6BA|nr:hypothetical protein [Rhizobium gei]